MNVDCKRIIRELGSFCIEREEIMFYMSIEVVQ